MRHVIMVLLLLLLYEGFYLLPQRFVELIPGSFRLLDATFFILMFFFFLSIQSIFRSIHRFGEESLLVLTACALVLLSPLMAYIFFGQPYYRGLLLMRHNLTYLTFFIFVLCIRSREDLGRLLNLLTLLVGVYVVILLITKYFPDLGLIHLPYGYFIGGGKIRFGEFRLFFPYGDITVLFFCITLARLLYAPKTDSRGRKVLEVGLVLLVTHAILSTYTRILVFSLLAVTAFALFTSKRPLLRYFATFLVLLFIFIQVVAMAASGKGVSFIEDSAIGKMIFQESSLAPEEGREFQFWMYMKNFLKSPLVGVGNIASGKLDYEANPYMIAYRKYGLFNTTDLGYPKILAEQGLLGLAWVVWFYTYLYRRTRQTLTEALKWGDEPAAEAVARGLKYFLIYLIISGFTLPHFVYISGIPAIVLTLAFMAVTRESLQLRIASLAPVSLAGP